MADDPSNPLSSFYTVVVYFLAILYSLTFLICSFRVTPYLFIKKKAAADEPLNRVSIVDKNAKSIKSNYSASGEPLISNDELPIVAILSDSSKARNH